MRLRVGFYWHSFQARFADIEGELQATFPPIVEKRISEKTGKELKDKVTLSIPAVDNRLLRGLPPLVLSLRRRLRREYHHQREGVRGH
jgi:hypothetical protein